MRVTHYEQVAQQLVEMDGAAGCSVRWLISRADGAPNFAMRQFEVAAGGHTPKHTHPYEHEVFVLEGEGIVVEGEIEYPLRSGDVVFVNPDEVHQFRNTGAGSLKFLCLVPNTAPGAPAVVPPECGLES